MLQYIHMDIYQKFVSITYTLTHISIQILDGCRLYLCAYKRKNVGYPYFPLNKDVS